MNVPTGSNSSSLATSDLLMSPQNHALDASSRKAAMLCCAGPKHARKSPKRLALTTLVANGSSTLRSASRSLSLSSRCNARTGPCRKASTLATRVV
jgi:hypothetical protein